MFFRVKVKVVLMIFFLIGSECLLAQEEIKVFAEKKEGGFILYASNDAHCPISLDVLLDLENMKALDGVNAIHVVPGRTAKFKLGELDVVVPTRRYTYSSKFRFNYGDAGQTTYDKDHVYDLPFPKGNRFMMVQGYNGKTSHQNENALDFTMPEGTDILAARGGIVIKVQEDNTRSCPEASCGQFNNNVIIYHSDGTFAEYTHIRKDGAKVEVGETVKTGDLIAFSGNTGWTTGPHLHFVCFLQGIEKRSTLPTKFKVEDGRNPAILEEKSWYSRAY